MKKYRLNPPESIGKLVNATTAKSGVFIHHTGTMYGIGCFLSDEEARKRIDAFKQRPDSKGYIVLIPGADWLERYDIRLSAPQQRFLDQYWPGNLTAILPTGHPDLRSVAQNGQVAFRVPLARHLRDFLVRANRPMLTTSVNKSGLPSLKDPTEIAGQFGALIDTSILFRDEYTEHGLPVPESTMIRFIEDGFEVVREGSILTAELWKSWESPQVLFVCTGNICRSPIAEYLARTVFEERGMSYRSASAGFLPGGVDISLHSYTVLKQAGIDALGHISTRISPDIVRKSLLILTMEDRHKQDILRHLPQARDKTFTLREYTGEPGDIEDPYGGDLAMYEETFEQIRECVNRLAGMLSRETITQRTVPPESR